MLKPLFMKRPLSLLRLLLAALGFFLLLGGASAAAPVDVARVIQPNFAARCYECHGEKKQKSDYRLDIRQTALSGGGSGKPAIVPGNRAESALLKHVTSTNTDE